MQKGKLAKKEINVIKMLLEKHDIYDYEIIPDAPVGKSLPGSDYAHEIESMSGFVVTSQKIYSFWLDWYEGHYTLGDEEGFWEENTLEETRSDPDLHDLILKAQQKLRAK